jgi:hypothetical protein
MDNTKHLLEKFIHDGYQSCFLSFPGRYQPLIKVLTGLIVHLCRQGTHVKRGSYVFVPDPADSPVAPDGGTGFIDAGAEPNKGTELFVRGKFLERTRDNDQLQGRLLTDARNGL